MYQLSIFDIMASNTEPKKERCILLKDKLKVFEAFAGVGSQRMALRNLGIPHEVVGIAEIDKFAIKSYNAIHGDTPNYGDISKIDANELPNIDLFTYSFPCQDLSVAGKKEGLAKGTRSGLLYECERIIEAKRPKYLLLENVKNLVGKKFRGEFELWLEYLRGLGYTNYWKVLNAKDYGVPQNRERVFVVSILDDEVGYEYPQAIELETRIRDILEEDVAETYYLNRPFKLVDRGRVQAELLDTNFRDLKEVGGVDTYFKTLKARLEGLSYRGVSQILGSEGICNTLDTMQGGCREPKILEYNGEGVELPCIAASRGRDINNPSDRSIGNKNLEQVLEPNTRGTSNTLTTVAKDNYAIEDDYRVRKLTPLECWRLMGFNDEDFNKAREVCSNTQLYKQAGNSIVVPVLEGIFKNLFK